MKAEQMNQARAQAAEAAAPQERKPYTKPAMERIDIGHQLLLAASQASGPPVQVAITTLPAVDYYFVFCGGDNWFYLDGRRMDGGRGIGIDPDGWNFGCGDLGSSFLASYAAKATALRDYVDGQTDCARLSNAWFPERCQCGAGLLATPGLTPLVTFVGADWDVEEFFANATFNCGSAGEFSGEFKGQRFEGRIEDGGIVSGESYPG